MKSSSLLLALATSLGAYAAPASLKRDTATYDIILSKSADVAAVLSQLDITVDDEAVTSTYNSSFFKVRTMILDATHRLADSCPGIFWFFLR